MSRPKSARLRMSLFASSSLVGTSLLAGMGGLVVTMAPGAAMAACTPTSTGGTTTVNCIPPSDAALVLTTVNPADTALVVNFNGEVVTAGGTTISDTGATATQAITLNSVSGTNSTNNAAGAGLTLDGTVKGSALNLTSTVPLTITGTTGGLVTKATTGATTITQTGAVSASAGTGVSLTSTTGAITYTGGPGSVSGTLNANAFQATSAGGALNINTGTSAVAAAKGDGVYLYQSGGAGAITYTSTGTLTTGNPAASYALDIVNSGSGATTVTLGATGIPVNQNVVLDGGVHVVSGTNGAVTVTTNGAINNSATGRAAIDLFANTKTVALTSTGNVTSTGGSAVRAATTGGAAINLNFNTPGQTITGAGTLGNATIFTSGAGGTATVNIGANVKPTNSQSTLPGVVTVGTGLLGASTTGIVLGASGSGNVVYKVGQSITGNDALGGTLASVTQLAGTAVLNGHVDFSGLTGNSTITLVGENISSTGNNQSVWNLGGTAAGLNNTSNFGAGNDAIENRGVINIGNTATPAQVVMNFGGPGAVIPIAATPGSAGPPVVAPTTAIPGAVPVQTGTPNGDRFYNRGAQSPSSTQNLYTPGTINIVGVGGNLTVTGLEVFTNEGASFLNIRNNSNASDFVGQGGSKTAASAQSFGMNPVTAAAIAGGAKNSDYYSTLNGVPVSTSFSQFALLSGTLPGAQAANGIPGQQQLSGGVNLADGDTLDVFATSGQLYGNANYNSTPVTGSRFLVDFDLKAQKADQLWFGDLFGNVSVIPRFNFVGAGIAPTYDPNGIRFASIVANPVVDNSMTVDYQSFFNQKDITYLSLANSQGDQGLYRAFVVYKQGQGATSVTVNGSSTDFSSKTATGGYFLTFLPDTEFYQLATLGSTVQEAVRDTTSTYFTRQADLRDAVGDDIAGGWLKISGSHAKLQEDVPYKFVAQGPGFTRTVGNYYTQTTVDVTGGGDAVAAVGKGKLVVGAAIGYTDSDVRFLGLGYGGVSGGQVSAPIPFIPRYDENRTALEGYHLGAYASYIQDQFFVDGSLSYTSLDLHSLFATLNNAVFSTNTKTLDAKVLSGMRFVTDDVFSVEPVVGLDFMETQQDDLNFGSAYGATAVSFPKFRSVQPGVGARVKVASATDLYKLNLGLGAMWWHEIKKDGSRIKATSGGNGFDVADLRGGLDTVAVDTSVNMIFANGLSANINVNAHGNMDAYLDVGFNVGARYRW
ncbi:MAG: hypothetical protein JWM33_2349 [Caulobacteraceae bacterium]|nr:hypothetical protein [Caulobacteraceae bacterium]